MCHPETKHSHSGVSRQVQTQHWEASRGPVLPLRAQSGSASARRGCKGKMSSGINLLTGETGALPWAAPAALPR